MAFTFDGPNKLIVLSSGTVGVVLADLYSRYKDWLLAGNAGFVPAMDTVGGEPIDPTAGTLVPLYLFLKNGWKIRPHEATHTLKVTDGVLVVAGGGDPFVNTLGNYSVRVNFSQPVQAFGYSTSGGSGVSAGDIADAVLAVLSSTTIPVDAKKMNGAVINGTGSTGDLWRGA